MKIKIEYVDGQTQNLDGEYEAHENYIELRIPTSRGEDYLWYDVIIPLHAIMHFEVHP